MKTSTLEVRLDGERLLIRFDRNPQVLNQVRALPARKFDGASRTWIAPHTKENWEAMVRFGWPVDHIPEPKVSGYRIETKGGKLLAVHCPPSPVNIQACRDIPDYRTWDSDLSAWVCKPTMSNLNHLQRSFPEAEWTEDAQDLVRKVAEKTDAAATSRELKHGIVDQESVEVKDFRFGGPPRWEHQKKLFLLSRDREAFGFLLEQGTGKTACLLDNCAWLHVQGRLTGALVVCPNTVKDQYPEEAETYLPEFVNADVVVYRSSPRKEEREAIERVTTRPSDPTHLTFLVMNGEALATEKGQKAAAAFLARHKGKSMMVIDESSRFRNTKAQRVKAARKLGKMADFRRILTGTPQPKNPLDWFAQMRFLDEDILGYSSQFSFRNEFAIMGGFKNKEVTGFHKLDKLQGLIDPHVFRVLKDDCLDLPPKVYQRAVLEMTSEQKRLYTQMKKDMVAELSGQECTATIVLTQLTRLQQILGGFVPMEDPDNLGAYDVVPIPGGNPILEDLMEWVEDCVTGKFIVWSRFRAECELVARSLQEKYGVDAVREFHGGVKERDRATYRREFQDPESGVKFLVAQIQTGGIGITLTQGTNVYYYSNTPSLEDRLQSEDRSHRAGVLNHVTYRDPVFAGTVGEKWLQTLREKKNLADQVTGDAWKEWI